MFDEKHFRTLQNIKISAEKKQADFEEIKKRGAQKVVYWQLYAVIISIACVALFLVVTMPQIDQVATSEAENKQMIAIYKAYEKANPTSVYQLGVSRITNEDALLAAQQKYDQLQPVNKPKGANQIYSTYRFNFSDHSTQLLYEYHISLKVYYEDVHTGQFYQLEDGSGIPLLEEDKLSTLQYSILFALLAMLLGASFYINRQLRDETDAKRKLPRHSHISQSIIMISFFLCIFFIIIFIQQIHFLWIVVGSLAITMINILIENKYGKNHWRKLSFIVLGLLVPTYLYITLWL